MPRILAADHRDIAWRLEATAARMSGYRDLPMARHDPATMAGRRPLEVFEHLVTIEQELLELLQGRAQENRAIAASTLALFFGTCRGP